MHMCVREREGKKENKIYTTTNQQPIILKEIKRKTLNSRCLTIQDNSQNKILFQLKFRMKTINKNSWISKDILMNFP